MNPRNFFSSALVVLLRPAIRFCLRHQLGIQDVHELSKRIFVEEAENSLRGSGEIVNISRVSVLTGIRRKEIPRLRSGAPALGKRTSLMTKVIGRWLFDRNYSNPDGSPRLLSFSGRESEFHSLVRAVTSDLGAGTVLSELERVGAVERVKGKLELVAEAYEPGSDREKGFELLGMDTEDLVRAVEENVLKKLDPPNHHAATEFSRVPKDKALVVKRWLLKQGDVLHKNARKFLSKLDQDVNPRAENGETVRVVLGSFSRVSETETKKE